MHPEKEEGFLVYDPNLTFTVFINKGSDKGLHWHTYIELLYAIRGGVQICVGKEKFNMARDDFMIINSHEPHSSSFRNSGDSEILVIQFEPSLLNPNLSSVFESKYIIPFIQNQIYYSKLFKLDKDSQLKFYLNEIQEEFFNKLPGYELNVKGNIFKVFSWLIRKNHIRINENSHLNDTSLDRLKKLLQYIEKNYSKEISNETAADMTCMSYHHFCRYFRKVTGKTFKEYVNFVRLNEAEKLLITTDISVTKIAFLTGFPNVSYFNRVFKRTKNVTPLAYREQNSARLSHN